MNLEIVRMGKLNSSDISIYQNGVGTITAGTVKSFTLENKKVLFAIDKEDSNHRFLYLSTDENQSDPNAILLTKKKSGTFQFGCSKLKPLCNGSHKASFVFKQKTHQGNRGWIQFERQEIEKIQEPVTAISKAPSDNKEKKKRAYRRKAVAEVH